MHAALAGQGLAIGRIELIQPLIDSGQLAIVDLPCMPMKSPNAVWLLLADDQPRDVVRKVAEWIQLEAAQVRSWPAVSLPPADVDGTQGGAGSMAPSRRLAARNAIQADLSDTT